MEKKIKHIREFADIPFENVVWEEEVGEEEFALVIFRLCNDKGLTFKEAMALATPGEFRESLAKRWGSTTNNVSNLGRKGYMKLINNPNTKEGWDYLPSHLTFIQAPFIHLFKGK